MNTPSDRGPGEVDFRQLGYDDFIDFWCRHGCRPSASDCGARYMNPESDARRDYLRGWQAARDDSLTRPTPPDSGE